MGIRNGLSNFYWCTKKRRFFSFTYNEQVKLYTQTLKYTSKNNTIDSFYTHATSTFHEHDSYFFFNYLINILYIHGQKVQWTLYMKTYGIKSFSNCFKIKLARNRCFHVSFFPISCEEHPTFWFDCYKAGNAISILEWTELC